VFSFPAVKYDPDPFPHCVVKGAWDDELLKVCKGDCSYVKWSGAKVEPGKTVHKRSCSDWSLLPSIQVKNDKAWWSPAQSVREVIEFAHQPRFLMWLETVTGEKQLLPDPYLFGGGLHRINRGGSLGMHIDFNYHGIGLYRRLNLLLYLNDWKDEWGGHLSLAGQKKVAPERNTMVVFTTDDKSWHGHPEPLECPEGVFRDSIALYYYSAIKPTRNFAQVRPTTEYEPVDPS